MVPPPPAPWKILLIKAPFIHIVKIIVWPVNNGEQGEKSPFKKILTPKYLVFLYNKLCILCFQSHIICKNISKVEEYFETNLQGYPQSYPRLTPGYPHSDPRVPTEWLQGTLKVTPEWPPGYPQSDNRVPPEWPKYTLKVTPGYPHSAHGYPQIDPRVPSK